MLKDYDYKDVGLSLKYILIDNNEYSKEKLLGSNSIVGYAMQADRCKTEEEFEEVIKKMITVKPQMCKEIIGMIEFVFNRKLNKTELEKYESLVKEGKVEEIIMLTVRDRIALDIYRKGKAEGNLQTTETIAKKLQQIGMKKDVILKITGIDIDELKDEE